MFNYIIWNPDLVALHLGPLSIRWYALCWMIGLMLAYFYVQKLYSDQKIPNEKFEPLFLYCFIGVLLGARLGHCIFYQPEDFLFSTKGWFEMFIPVKLFGEGVIESICSGQWKFIGYEGLASHGGTLGLMIALLLYSRKIKMKLLFVIDAVAIATPVTACAIRLGNLMNSEIIGKPTDLPWAFVFERVDTLPRHPGQLYEAIAYALLAIIMYLVYKKTNISPSTTTVRTDFKTGKALNKESENNSLEISENAKKNSSSSLPSSFPNKLMGTGFYFGLCLLYIFTARIFIELTKENQEAFEEGMILNMGQLLSLPFVILGALAMWRGYKTSKK